MKQFIIVLFIFIVNTSLWSQQVAADTSYVPQLKARYVINKGPVVAVDTLHHNFHIAERRFLPFATLLKRDGFQFKTVSNLKQLNGVDVYVISNPIHPNNIGNWQRPIYNAFSKEDINHIKTWVANGGSLLLIADHMPFAGAANSLAQAFGFDFCDGFAQLSKALENDPDIFSINNSRLKAHTITNGTIGDVINSVTTFTGSSFTIPEKAIGLLKFIEDDVCLSPDIAWQFNEETQSTTLDNQYQGAVLNYGKGKLAVFGEAAMFTSQTITTNNRTFNVGFTSPLAPNNVAFIRNVMYWLATKK